MQRGIYFPSTFKIGATLKGKNLLKRSKFFPLRVAQSEKGGNYRHDRVISLEGMSISLHLNHLLIKFSRRKTDDIFLTFPRKQALTFHVNCLLRWREYTFSYFGNFVFCSDDIHILYWHDDADPYKCYFVANDMYSIWLLLLYHIYIVLVVACVLLMARDTFCE